MSSVDTTYLVFNILVFVVVVGILVALWDIRNFVNTYGIPLVEKTESLEAQISALVTKYSDASTLTVIDSNADAQLHMPSGFYQIRATNPIVKG